KGVPNRKPGPVRKAAAERPILENWRIVPGKVPGKREYQYAQAVFMKPSCLEGCHGTRDGGQGKAVFVKPEDRARRVGIPRNLDETNKAIHQNRAILITAALVTAILAMVASYVIVRYVIVKPVKHLRDVSDAIAAGKLTIRSQIQT